MEKLDHITPERLDVLQDRLRLIGAILGQMALLEVVADSDAPATARVSAAKTLTDMGGEPQTIIERLKSSPFLDKSPAQLRKMIQDIQDGETDIEQLIDGDLEDGKKDK